MSLFLDRPDDLDVTWTWAIRQPGLDWDQVRDALRAGRAVHWIRRMDGAGRIGLVAALERGRAAVYLHPAAADVASDVPGVLAAAGYVGGTLTDFVPALTDALAARADRSRERQWWTIVPAGVPDEAPEIVASREEPAWFADLYDACYAGEAGEGARTWERWSRDPQFPHRRVWFVVEAARPVAFYVGTRERAGEEYVCWLGTRPGHRRRGVALHLLQGAVARAVAEGCFSASIVIAATNTGGRALLRAAGFHRLWRRLAWGRAV